MDKKSQNTYGHKSQNMEMSAPQMYRRDIHRRKSCLRDYNAVNVA
jgi:hypothetical protein